MAMTVLLEVITPTGPVVKIAVDQVEAPSVNGEFGVLPGHLPLLAALEPGVVRYRTAGKLVAIAVGPGFAEAGMDRVTVLTDSAVEGSEVDVASVKSERDEVLKQLESVAADAGNDYEELLRKRRWLDAQLDAARESGKS
ncbi:MAG: ATP synthase F1 subunit epsilon [Deltaproteobacteria bacterium]|nr:ATP synthase F1 subunit epsilon [Deltaproteobacteria bacterium]